MTKWRLILKNMDIMTYQKCHYFKYSLKIGHGMPIDTHLLYNLLKIKINNMTTLLFSPFGMKVGYPSVGEDLNQKLNRFVSEEAIPAVRQMTNRFANPAVNIVKSDVGYDLYLSIPGYSKDNVTLSVEQQVLTVQGTKEHTEVEGEKYLYKEFTHLDFKRNFSLGETLDPSSIKATFANGILNIRIAFKPEVTENQKISIQVN